ncbi:hypothetical protein NFI96_014988 [Prochilodus magdalenae]|nr:hypothetical protein NFI96_014988 [Prochilodus magdalenae]
MTSCSCTWGSNPPKSVSVSISPPGGIVDGSSVTLTCSSDAYPPVKIYTWFKGSTSVGNGDTYNIPNIRSEHSGEYTCQSRNEHGERRSIAAQINVQYPPKSVSVSISPPGKTVGGSSVNVTCSSDANPPVKNYKPGFKRRWILTCRILEYSYSPYTEWIPTTARLRINMELRDQIYCQRKKQTRNMNEPDHVNEGHRTRCPDNSYRDVDSDENVAKAGLNTPPSDNGSSSADDYVNTPKAGLNAPPSDDDDDSSNDYVNTPVLGETHPRSSMAVLPLYAMAQTVREIVNEEDSQRKVSVSISPSGEIVDGQFSDVLTCTLINGNPPVKNYTWV